MTSQWDGDNGRRGLADYLAHLNDGLSVRGKPGLWAWIRRLFATYHA